ncbi:MAG: hypothetical protein JW723_13820 [Bacteroidales bacterium]|nr:hypothetical protein [Bacteroidales bacterium]
MRDKLIRWIIYIAGIVCAFAFLSIRISPGMMNVVLKIKTYPEFEDFTKYGELYMFCMVNDYKEDLPQAQVKYRLSSKNPALSQADILVFGDSQFDHSRHLNVPEALGDTLQKKAYYHRYTMPHWAYVLSLLKANNYRNNGRKPLVFETTERYIHNRFINDPDVFFKDPRSKPKKILALIRDRLFNTEAEYLYNILLKRSYFTTDIYACISTLKFRLFDMISSMTPRYTTGDDNWLFYKDNIDHFYCNYSDKDIETVCDNILKLSGLLKERYDLDFIFLPLPEKYTLYHHIINNDDDSDFLNKVYAGLDKRNVPYINLLRPFKDTGEYVYPRTDTHLNELGVSITVSKVLDLIKNDTTYNYLFN